MKILIFAIAFFIVSACQQPKAEVTEAAGTEKVVVARTVADTIKPQRKQHYVIDQSRQKQEMDTIFPYDIEITSAVGKPLNTSTAFQPNGKPTILLFWLTTCYPCRIELEAIKKNYPAWKQETDFNLFAVSTDFPRNYEKYLAMVEQNNWPFPAFHDSKREFRKVMPGALNGLPQVFVLDANGKIVYHKRKYRSGDEHKLYAKVKEIAMR